MAALDKSFGIWSQQERLFEIYKKFFPPSSFDKLRTSEGQVKFLRFSFLPFIRRLFCEYKQGFGALSAGVGAASALPDSPNSPFLWTTVDSNH